MAEAQSHMELQKLMGLQKQPSSQREPFSAASSRRGPQPHPDDGRNLTTPVPIGRIYDDEASPMTGDEDALLTLTLALTLTLTLTLNPTLNLTLILTRTRTRTHARHDGRALARGLQRRRCDARRGAGP